jgi:hypothetical protein
MREVNAAWAVLRSPADRAAYDEQLRAATPGGSTRPAATGPAPAMAEAASFEGQLVDPRSIDPRVGGPVRAHRARWVPVVIVLALVAAGIGLAVVTTSNRSGSPPEPVVRTNRYEVGSCVAVQPGPAGPVVSVVSCGLPNSGRVAATTDYPRPCPAGTDAVALVDEQVSVCLVAS